MRTLERLLAIHRLVVEVSPKILRRLPYFLLPMMPRGLQESKFPFRVAWGIYENNFDRFEVIFDNLQSHTTSSRLKKYPIKLFYDTEA